MTDVDVVPASDDELEYVRGQVRAMVRAGFTSFDQVLQAADEMLEPDTAVSLRAVATAAVRQEWEARVAEQASWTDEGDYTALAAAFADLESQLVVARMCFTCCNTCGATEIHDEVDPDGASPVGYTFFHSQEADRLADTRTDLYLSFGGFADTRSEVVGELVTATIARHGFEVEWNGDAGAKVRVRVTDWRKGLPGETPLAAPARLRARPERGEVSLDPTPYELLVFLHRVRRGWEQFFIVEDTTKADWFVQTTLVGDGPGFVVEYRDGVTSALYHATGLTLDLAHRIVTGWTTDADGWRDLTDWTRIDL
ncbi:hypothetical protein L1785_22125 [Antribacter sp. KLBMP9083]|uniref:DUF6891 domain-containing protein n=1 Tax=Antribacter soli TaxID=2910976 RepID=A0AA41QHM6_9MICO|nr:hypothetical protein [Antribacter soli]MCF4123663.1 hypothetical protein [Antribacter soli]